MKPLSTVKALGQLSVACCTFEMACVRVCVSEYNM